MLAGPSAGLKKNRSNECILPGNSSRSETDGLNIRRAAMSSSDVKNHWEKIHHQGTGAAELPADRMTSASATPLTEISRRVVRLQIITLVWMSVEAIASIGTAWHAHSPALLGFGGDSLIELLSAAIVFWRFRFHCDEARAARVAGALLFALAGLILLTSVLTFLGYHEAQRTMVGIGILVAAAVAMPWLARRKRKLAVLTSSAALKADATESALCGFMAWIALAGVSVNAIWGRSWADPVAALALIPLIVREAWEAFHSAQLECHGCF